MKRLALLTSLLLVAGALFVFGTGSGSNNASGNYKVRAIFSNAFSVIPGEDVKIAGVKVGSIESLGLTPDQKAAVVLDITEPGFGNWRNDAECTIRPQSLIGEKFVECTPTQPREAGQPVPPFLPKIKSGPGKGDFLLTNTKRPIDIDLVGDTLRLPYRQRLTLLLNEFGTALAGRGADLNQVIRKADPALSATDKVLNILAGQNKVLSNLARDSDTAIAPLARERQRVVGFINKANATNVATAERRGDFERNIQKLPAFLRQIQPTMVKLSELSDQATPVLSDLNKVAPSVSRFIEQLGPFSKASTPAIVSLGKATIPGRKAVVASRGIVQNLRTFGQQVKPLAANLSQLLTSIRDTGGIERLMDYLFYQVAAINGFDTVGHYLRADLVVNLCSTYATTPDPACNANFVPSASATRTSARAALDAEHHGRTPALAREDAVLRGMSPQEALGKTPASSSTRSAKASSGSAAPSTASVAPGTLTLPTQVLPGGGKAPAKSAGASTGSGSSTPAIAGQPKTVNRLLNYLLGPS